MNSLKRLYRYFKRSYAESAVHDALLLGFSKSRLSAAIWYLFSGHFGNEQIAVLAGRAAHRAEMRKRERKGARYTLRRNVHRLEKGLIMRPRRSVFARDYIVETADVYAATVEQFDVDDVGLLQWAKEVLTEYFSVVGEEVSIDRARQVFESVSAGKVPDDAGRPKRPYARELDVPIGISIDDLERLAIRRRSCRWFLPDPVPREKINLALRVAGYAPSACNRQPFQFRFYDEPELVKKVASIPMGTVGFYENFPCVAVIVGEFSAFPFDRDRHVPYIDASLAAMGFQFALEVQGLSSCCINWPDITVREKMLATLIGLESHERAVMMMAIGYPDPTGQVPYSQKKPISLLGSYNQC